MAKAFNDETNTKLRAIALTVMKRDFGGNRTKLARHLKVTPTFVSDFLNHKRGAGLDLLSGLGRYAPLEVLSILGIRPVVITTLAERGKDETGEALAKLPDELRRAARAAIELTGCTPGEACEVAVDLFKEIGVVEKADVDFWLPKVRKAIEAGQKRTESGERPSGKMLTG
jgi:hypothetical protein